MEHIDIWSCALVLILIVSSNLYLLVHALFLSHANVINMVEQLKHDLGRNNYEHISKIPKNVVLVL